MKIAHLFFYLFLAISALASCSGNQQKQTTAGGKTENVSANKPAPIIVGAEQFDLYEKFIKAKNVALVVNQSSLVKGKHLLDFLLEKKIKVVKIFALEHGFRGNIDRGKHVDSNVDEATGIPIVSMFGSNRKPKNEQLADVDVVIFDIQDAGARFFTYISSMHELMEACAVNHKKLLIFDRPNPLGDYVDGPVRKAKFKSFVGMHPIPVVHGLTVGELAQMINGEKWLKDGKQCDIEVIKLKNYKHSMQYSLPIKPSPNLPNDLSIRLYPSLCFFEATPVSVGRGTLFPFQVVAYPDASFGDSLFIPQDIEGMQINPIQEGKVCYGVDLRGLKPHEVKFTLKYVIDFYNKFDNKELFFSRKKWFNLLVGNDLLIEQIKSGMSEKEIRAQWKNELDDYKKMRKKYLLYD